MLQVEISISISEERIGRCYKHGGDTDPKEICHEEEKPDRLVLRPGCPDGIVIAFLCTGFLLWVYLHAIWILLKCLAILSGFVLLRWVLGDLNTAEYVWTIRPHHQRIVLSDSDCRPSYGTIRHEGLFDSNSRAKFQNSKDFWGLLR